MITVDNNLLDMNNDGLRIVDSEIVNIEKDIDPKKIIDLLEIIDCGVISCSKE